MTSGQRVGRVAEVAVVAAPDAGPPAAVTHQLKTAVDALLRRIGVGDTRPAHSSDLSVPCIYLFLFVYWSKEGKM